MDSALPCSSVAEGYPWRWTLKLECGRGKCRIRTLPCEPASPRDRLTAMTLP